MEPAAPPRNAPAAPEAGRPPLFVAAAALLLYFLRFGYDYGTSDQDEIIPFLMHRMDPGVFTQDWLVQIQVADFSVRTFFVWLLHAFALFLPVWLAVLLLHVAAWLLVAGAVYALARHFTADRLAAAAAVVLALVLTPMWTLGGNELVHSMLVPSTLAWGLALWATYHFLRSRYIFAPVLLGVACWIQALVGLQVAGLLILLRLVNIVRKERGPFTVGSFVTFAGLFVLWSSPALGPILYQQLTAPAIHTEGLPSLFYVLAEFRLPHHYLFFSFHTHSLVRFGALAVLGGGALAVPALRARLHDATFLVRVLAVIAALCAFAFVFTELVPVLFVAKLQLFKLTVLAKLLLLIVIAGAACAWLPAAVRRPFEALFDHRHASLAAMLVVWAAVGFAVVRSGDGYLHELVRPWERQTTDYGEVQAWVRANTSHAAIFAVPPSDASFRSATGRTIVVNYKAIPYQDANLFVWFNRLTGLAPLSPLPERGSPELPAHLDEAFNRLTSAELWRLRATYKFDYVVRSAPLDAPDGRFREAFRKGEWYVYEALPEPGTDPGTDPEGEPGAAPSPEPEPDA